MLRVKCSVFLLFLCILSAKATHLRCGEISVQQVGPASNRTFTIRITVYTNTINAVAFFGGDLDYLDFGDGTPPILVPEVKPGDPPFSVIDQELGIAKAYFEITHLYKTTGNYIVSYKEANRNPGIINFDHSVNTPFYLETKILVSNTRNYSSPDFIVPPIFLGTSGEEFAISMAASDPNDYRLVYKLVTPLQAKQTPVVNYRLPGQTHLNMFNGLITWDGMFLGSAALGEFLLAAKVFQIDGDEVVGYVMRDIQIIADSDWETEFSVSDNQELDDNNRIFVEPESSYKIKVFASSNQKTSLEYYSSFSFEEPSDMVSFETYDSLNGTMIVGVLTISPDAASVRDNPYVLTIRANVSNSFQPSRHYGSKDINYLIYTKDIEPIILGVKEERTVSKLYPNPTKDIIKIHYSGGEKLVRIIDQSGRIVLNVKPAEEGIIDLSPLPQGLYLVETTDGTNKLVSRERVMKE